MREIAFQYFITDLGELILGSFNEHLCLCDWRYRKMRDRINKRLTRGLDAHFVHAKTGVTSLAREQLEEYFSGHRTGFDIPLLMVGSAFQKSVWDALLEIPYGKTESYMGLARKIGDEKAIRSVAAANGANAVSIFIPCHRVVGSDGSLTGYGGGLGAKWQLLQLEMSGQTRDQMTLFGQ
jgi:methylated-DNA-[protein]-cysteine S-methyltransferase